MPSTKSFSGISAIRHAAKRTLWRFPLVLLSATVATGIGISWVYFPKHAGDLFFLVTGRVMLLGLLGIPLLYSLTLMAERRRGMAKSLPWLGLVALGLYYLRLNRLSSQQIPEAFFFEVAAFWVGLHFLAAFAPFLRTHEARGFWEYNRSLFLRFLLALLFSLTLWLGVGILFGILSLIVGKDLTRIAGCVGIVILGIFNTWFFLAGIPDDWRALDQEPRPFPRALKFFGQFILVPLVVLIGLGLEILFIKAYGKSPEETSTMAGGLILLGAVGLLTYLLLYPLSAEPGGRWLNIFRRGLAIALLPALVWLAYTAIGEIRTQGWTPPNYYLVLLSAWGLAMAVYLTAAPNPKIQWIPESLFLLAFLSTFPVVGAASTTLRSQQNRLDALFRQYHLQKGAPDLQQLVTLPNEARTSINTTENVLLKYLGCAGLKPSFGDAVDLREKESVECRSARLMAALDLGTGQRILQEAEVPAIRVNFNRKNASTNQGVSVDGFHYYFSEGNIQLFYKSESATSCPTQEVNPILCTIFDRDKQRLEFFLNRQPLGLLDLTPTLTALAGPHAKDLAGDNKEDRYFDPTDAQMTFDYDLQKKQIRLIFSHIFLEKRGESLTATDVTFSALLK